MFSYNAKELNNLYQQLQRSKTTRPVWRRFFPDKQDKVVDKMLACFAPRSSSNDAGSSKGFSAVVTAEKDIFFRSLLERVDRTWFNSEPKTHLQGIKVACKKVADSYALAKEKELSEKYKALENDINAEREELEGEKKQFALAQQATRAIKTENETLKQQNLELQTRITALEREQNEQAQQHKEVLAKLQQEKNTLEQNYQTLDQGNQRLQQRLEAFQAENQAKDVENKKSQAEVKQLQQSLSRVTLVLHKLCNTIANFIFSSATVKEPAKTAAVTEQETNTLIQQAEQLMGQIEQAPLGDKYHKLEEQQLKIVASEERAKTAEAEQVTLKQENAKLQSLTDELILVLARIQLRQEQSQVVPKIVDLAGNQTAWSPTYWSQKGTERSELASKIQAKVQELKGKQTENTVNTQEKPNNKNTGGSSWYGVFN